MADPNDPNNLRREPDYQNPQPGSDDRGIFEHMFHNDEQYEEEEEEEYYESSGSERRKDKEEKKEDKEDKDHKEEGGDKQEGADKTENPATNRPEDPKKTASQNPAESEASAQPKATGGEPPSPGSSSSSLEPPEDPRLANNRPPVDELSRNSGNKTGKNAKGNQKEFQEGGGPAVKTKGSGSSAGSAARSGSSAAGSAAKSSGGGAGSKIGVAQEAAQIGSDLKNEGVAKAGEDLAVDVGAQAAGKAASVAVQAAIDTGTGGIGAVLAAALGAIVDWITQVVVKKLWPVLKKLLPLIMLANFMFIFMLVGTAASAASMASKGLFGRSETMPAGATDGNINTVLGEAMNGPARQWYFSQRDKQWGGESYGCGGSTIEEAGCGCTCAAMVLKKYGASIDPKIACDYSLSKGFRKCGSGTDADLFPSIAKKYNLKYEKVESWEGAKKLLEQGIPLIVCVGPGWWTSGGHYIVLTGINGNTVYTNDPYRDRKSGTVNQLLSQLAHGYYYIHP